MKRFQPPFQPPSNTIPTPTFQHLPPIEGRCWKEAVGLEGWWVLDLPRPPSVNRFMKKLGNKSPAVKKWTAHADMILMQHQPYPRLTGEYELVMEFPARKAGHFDMDNYVKATSDWLQSREIIENDRYSRRITLCWGEAPLGCRVKVRSWNG